MPRLPSLPPRIYVCGLDAMPAYARVLRPERLVSLLPTDQQPERPQWMRAGDHLRLRIDDVTRPEPGARAPRPHHAAALIEFLRASDPAHSLLFHCMAGVSRSTAAALIALALDAPGRELEAMRALRDAAPFACPNRLLVRHADDLLGREGRLVAAIGAVPPPDFFAQVGLITLPRSLQHQPNGTAAD